MASVGCGRVGDTRPTMRILLLLSCFVSAVGLVLGKSNTVCVICDVFSSVHAIAPLFIALVASELSTITKLSRAWLVRESVAVVCVNRSRVNTQTLAVACQKCIGSYEK